MAFVNEANWDRVLRSVAGVALLYAGWSVWTGAVGVTLLIVGAVALVTGLVGWCPAYALFHVATRRIVG